MERSSGMALPTSLVILVIVTMLGITALLGSRLNEKMISNFQQKIISFEIAESALAIGWNVNTIGSALNAIPADQINNPAPIINTVLNNQLSEEFDQIKIDGAGKTVDADVVVDTQYCGETSLPEGTNLNVDQSGLQLVGSLVNVSSAANIVGSKAISQHVKRGYLIRPKTGRIGACWAPPSS